MKLNSVLLATVGASQDGHVVRSLVNPVSTPCGAGLLLFWFDGLHADGYDVVVYFYESILYLHLFDFIACCEREHSLGQRGDNGRVIVEYLE